MTKAIDIITPALETLGVQSRILPADASLVVRAREYLAGILEQLAQEGIVLGTTDSPIVLPEDTATDINEKTGAKQPLIDLLTWHMAGPARVEVTPVILGMGKKAMKDLKRMFYEADVPNMVPSTLLTRGQGNTKGGHPRTFFNGNALADDASTSS